MIPKVNNTYVLPQQEKTGLQESKVFKIAARIAGIVGLGIIGYSLSYFNSESVQLDWAADHSFEPFPKPPIEYPFSIFVEPFPEPPRESTFSIFVDKTEIIISIILLAALLIPIRTTRRSPDPFSPGSPRTSPYSARNSSPRSTDAASSRSREETPFDGCRSRKEADRIFKRLALELHPDKTPGMEEEFKKLNAQRDAAVARIEFLSALKSFRFNTSSSS